MFVVNYILIYVEIMLLKAFRARIKFCYTNKVGDQQAKFVWTIGEQE